MTGTTGDLSTPYKLSSMDPQCSGYFSVTQVSNHTFDRRCVNWPFLLLEWSKDKIKYY